MVSSVWQDVGLFGGYDDSSHPDTSSTQIDAGIVQTGDIVNYSVWGLLLLISVVVVCYYINNRKLNR